MALVTLPAGELTEFDLPKVCVVTGATDGVEFKDVKFQWYPRWVMALVIINVLVAAIVAFAMTKRVKGKLPFTPEAYAAWRRGVTALTVSIVLAVGVFIGACVAFAQDLEVVGALGMLLAFAGPIAVGVLMVRGKRVLCTRIADGQITLKIPSESAAQAIEAHLHAGAVLPAVAVA